MATEELYLHLLNFSVVLNIYTIDADLVVTDNGHSNGSQLSMRCEIMGWWKMIVRCMQSFEESDLFLSLGLGLRQACVGLILSFGFFVEMYRSSHFFYRFHYTYKMDSLHI